MTEEQIERHVEDRTNRADNALMLNRITQAEYDERMKHLSRWAEQEYARLAASRKT